MNVHLIRIALFLLAFIGIGGLQAQAQAQIQFDQMTHDFGTLEEGAKATHVFQFSNTGQAEVRLHSVKASCGCTTPSWTREPVKPGERGRIEVTYDSKNRPGPFNKSITVTYDTTAGARPIILAIKGDVTKAKADAELPAQAPATTYEEVQGNLQLEKKQLMAGVVNSDQTYAFDFKVRNQGSQPLQLKQLKDTEPIYVLSWAKAVLKPGEETTGTIRMDMKKAAESGLEHNMSFNSVLTFETNDTDRPLKTIELNGTYKRIFTEAELAELPRITFNELTFDGGDILEGDKLEHSFEFGNLGKQPLQLVSVKASCGCTTPSWTKDAVPPGGTGKIDVVFNSAGKKGPQHKTVAVRTNDPQNDTVILHIKCNIKSDPFSAPSGTPVSPTSP